MKFKNIHVIVNPVAGSHESILAELNTAFTAHQIEWQISVTTNNRSAFDIAREWVNRCDLIVAYGGDGCVCEVARAMFKSKTPLAILPGGTANVMAKELGIPQDVRAAIDLLVSGNSKTISVDMGLANDWPFLIRVNFGIMADMILHTDQEMKEKLGQLAYGISTIQTIVNAEPTTYQLKIDGKELTEQSVALTITNAGGIGISDFSLLPGILITDGYFDIIILHDINLLSLLKIAGTTLFQTDSNVLKHFRCKKISISTTEPVEYLCDDEKKTGRTLDIKVIPKALKIVIPHLKK